MDFSDDWRSLWPISAVFAAPSLLPSTTHVGPLLFHPSPSPPHFLLSLPPLCSHVSPVTSDLDSLRALLRSAAPDAFLPESDIVSLADTFLPLSSVAPTDLFPTPALHALRSRRGSHMLLFFPTGENSHLIGYVSVSFEGSNPVLCLDRNGGVFTQRDGFKQPFHRITQITISSPSTLEVSGTSDQFIEGFLIATTLYSVNWFRIESKVLDLGRERPFLVPVAKQGFDRCVVHACWSPHFPEQSAVLLENGDLCWFNLDPMRGGTVRVLLDGGDPERWLSCEFGVQPWVLMVACSKAVVLVDLRSKDETKPRVLARIDRIDSVVRPMEDDRFLAFCRSSYNDFHFSMLTEHQLILFDLRQPLVPILTWDHGLDHPSYISMFGLSELRPSSEFKWASESGYAILAGSFWNDEFSLFCYGPKEGSVSANSSLYAWGLPSSICLSGWQCRSGDEILRELVDKKHLSDGFQWTQEKDLVVGFCRIPHDLVASQSEANHGSGFSIIRLMSSGKLELQGYHASKGFFRENSSCKLNDPLRAKNAPICCKSQEDKLSARYSYLKLQYLDGYLNGKLSCMLRTPNHQLDYQGTRSRIPSYHLRELICNGASSSNLSASHFIADTGIPTSIIEIASRKALTSLPLDLLPLTFATYGELFGYERGSSFELLEVPNCLSNNRFSPFFVGRPSRRSEKWLNKESTAKSLVGPILPLPVLLTLHQVDWTDKSSVCSKEEQDNDLLMLECKAVLGTLYPEVSIADDYNFNGLASSQELQDDKPFFIYEPGYPVNKSTYCTSREATGIAKEEEPPQVDQTCFVSAPVCKDEKFSTFICGIADKVSSSDPSKELEGSDVFNLSPIKLDFESSLTAFQPDELKTFKCLKRQFSKWMGNNKAYQDFCSSSKLPTLPK